MMHRRMYCALPGTFATNPEEAGMFYQWNSKVGWTTINPLLNSNGGTKWIYPWNGNNATLWKKANDPCPAGWRMPTQQEMQSLVNVSRVWTTINGVEGNLFSSGSNTLFLPALGFRTDENGTLNEGIRGKDGFYWSRSSKDETQAYSLLSSQVYVTPNNEPGKARGQLCRCVAE